MNTGLINIETKIWFRWTIRVYVRFAKGFLPYFNWNERINFFLVSSCWSVSFQQTCSWSACSSCQMSLPPQCLTAWPSPNCISSLSDYSNFLNTQYRLLLHHPPILSSIWWFERSDSFSGKIRRSFSKQILGQNYYFEVPCKLPNCWVRVRPRYHLERKFADAWIANHLWSRIF